eukprot:NODE_11_length_46995_cov_0.451872.p25 type:complete len:134 gc:universal NODE_11_length_46995_cov_0.451872:43818-43417(-)
MGRNDLGPQISNLYTSLVDKEYTPVEELSNAYSRARKKIPVPPASHQEPLGASAPSSRRSCMQIDTEHMAARNIYIKYMHPYSIPAKILVPCSLNTGRQSSGVCRFKCLIKAYTSGCKYANWVKFSNLISFRC